MMQAAGRVSPCRRSYCTNRTYTTDITVKSFFSQQRGSLGRDRGASVLVDA